MAGHAELARGHDKASKIMKYDGLPGEGNLIEEDTRKPPEIPVLGSFVSTMVSGGTELNPILSASSFGDYVEKPKLTAKITLIDAHSDDNF